MSLTSLMLCVSMLVGATFAWFTDSVTSGVNRIVSGNLDVTLQHANAGQIIEDVTSATKLFDKAANSTILWEPGAISYETFTVGNAGTLNLKYEMILIDGGHNTVNGGANSLLDVLKIAVTTDTISAASRIDPSDYTWTALKDFIGVGSINDGDLAPEDTDVYSVLLYWEPSDNNTDNIYNLNNGKLADDDSDELYVNLGITLVATQKDAEYDSFDNTYDAGLTVPAASSAAATGNVTTTTDAETSTTTSTATLSVPIAPVSNHATTVMLVAESNDGGNALGVSQSTETSEGGKTTTTTVSSTANLDATTKDPSGTSFAVISGDITAAILDLTLTVSTKTTTVVTDDTTSTVESSDSTESSDKVTTGFTALVETYVEAGLPDVKVVYPDSSDPSVAFSSGYSSTLVASKAEVDKVGEYYYNEETGYLVFMTDHFSDYAVTTSAVAKRSSDTGNLYYSSLTEAIGDTSTWSTQTIYLLKDIAEHIRISGAIVIDGNGHSIKGPSETTYENVIDLLNGTIKTQLELKHVTVDGENRSRCIRSYSEDSNIILGEDAVLQNGKKTSSPAETDGGGIWSNGTVNLQGGKITNCEGDRGGGIYIENGALYFVSGEVSHNTADEDGGGICIEGASFHMANGTDCIISGNIATYGRGGGIYSASPSFVMDGGAITDNTAVWGGGIYNNWNATIQGGTITNNTASSGGGGITNNWVLDMKDCTISNNTADNGWGGGIQNWYRADIDSGVEITGNTAAYGGGLYMYMYKDIYGDGYVTLNNGVTISGNHSNYQVYAEGTVGTYTNSGATIVGDIFIDSGFGTSAT